MGLWADGILLRFDFEEGFCLGNGLIEFIEYCLSTTLEGAGKFVKGRAFLDRSDEVGPS